MKGDILPLLKFQCDNKKCSFTCYLNPHNSLYTAYNTNMGIMLEWECPECSVGNLRFSKGNGKFNYGLQKLEKTSV